VRKNPLSLTHPKGRNYQAAKPIKLIFTQTIRLFKRSKLMNKRIRDRAQNEAQIEKHRFLGPKTPKTSNKIDFVAKPKGFRPVFFA
jgi:hypothetical protein